MVQYEFMNNKQDPFDGQIKMKKMDIRNKKPFYFSDTRKYW